MSNLNTAAGADRLHIGFFGCRNAGKSSLVNAVTGQPMSVVSDVKGTTTDPVTKSMELLPLGPVVIIDTPGFDDSGALGDLRVLRSRRLINRVDIAVLAVDHTVGLSAYDEELLKLFQEKKIPALIALTKCDNGEVAREAVPGLAGFAGFAGLAGSDASGQNAAGTPAIDYASASEKQPSIPVICVSAETGYHLTEFKELLGHIRPEENPLRLVGDLIAPGDTVVLVCPIDASAPKGRLILPQVKAIRDILDAGAVCLTCRETELQRTLDALKEPPRLVITDSQALGVVAPIVPADVPLTTFSILMARYKGFLECAIRGIAAATALPDQARILMAEGCTHHRQCEDIGTVKIPKMLQALCGKTFCFETSSGQGFPEDLSGYDLIIHCGACMLNDREVRFRMTCAEDQGIPFTNYGITLARCTGTLKRTLEIFPELAALLPED
ncbi:MAG: [FeFe] hydrogenase H-cluster maturation GTPase HydF [Lachnospiraceae bacterium]|nr:[FeFe] hydrogenase H-cluster maturation GTPase HydF [Lachnospiraceae bacterium]